MKKTLLLLSLLLCTICSFSQISVLKARAVTNFQGNGEGGLFHGTEHTEVDAWYLSFQALPGAEASSTLPEQGNYSYDADRASDINVRTCWVEGKEDYGVGEMLSFSFDPSDITGLAQSGNDVEGGYSKVWMAFLNGLTLNQKYWEANSRVAKFRFFLGDEPLCDIELEDTRKIQVVDMSEILLDFLFEAPASTLFSFEILEVYPGTKYKDTAVTEIMISRNTDPGFWDWEK